MNELETPSILIADAVNVSSLGHASNKILLLTTFKFETPFALITTASTLSLII